MRRKILFVALTAVALALTTFGVPLAVLISHNVTSQERVEIERLALRRALATTPGDIAGGQSPESGGDTEQVGLYDASGHRTSGPGPLRLESALNPSLHGSIAQSDTDSSLTVAVPVSEAGKVIGVVRAASPKADTANQIHQDWAILAVIGILAAAVAGLIALVQSQRLARPLQRLQHVALELGDGNLGARAPASGVAEIDRASAALNATAERLGDLIAREQAFSAHASHQLRTPLTGLRLQLEAALEADREGLVDAVRAGIRSADELSRTINDVVNVAHQTIPHGQPLSARDLLDDVRRRWGGLLGSQGRDIRVELDDAPPASAGPAAARQVLDVLLDNAYRHGRGTVTLRARGSSGALALDVIDEGRAGSLLPPSGTSLGLALAQSTATGQGGRLIQATDEAQTRFTLLLPGDIATSGHALDRFGP